MRGKEQKIKQLRCMWTRYVRRHPVSDHLFPEKVRSTLSCGRDQCRGKMEWNFEKKIVQPKVGCVVVGIENVRCHVFEVLRKEPTLQQMNKGRMKEDSMWTTA